MKSSYNKIVKTVRPNPNANNLQDKEEIIPVIFLTEILINVENLINLHNFSLENFEVTNEDLRILKDIKHHLNKLWTDNG
ncbi:hypothetical protein C1645_817338 [Glomus cerebriforme]|uniref:Uncharacterized protein n=1 Tax=Glomus cerebriforme TaxID=658196 RepID=A0A397TJB9_9GLOM|nr:hypothetical protein C1645_817338 [Glomus cerebriforme]